MAERKLPPLNSLRAFEATARQLSFTRAGAELHVTQAAVSHQIKALESHLGVRLLHRLTRRLTLTDVVEPGGEYALVVYTHNCSGRYAHPRSEQLSEGAEGALDTTFWYTSAATIGMEENVWLILEPLLRIDDVYVVTSVREKTTMPRPPYP